MEDSRSRVAEADLPLLLSVLSFYDRFAQQNRDATNQKLQAEVALANRKVGALYLLLDRDEEAETPIARAAEIFEGLLARSPDDPEVRFKLAQTYAMVEPWTTPKATLDRVEKRLQRARLLVDRLADGSPESFEYGHFREKVVYYLGVLAERRGQHDRAETSYREAIDLAGSLMARWPGGFRPAFDRAAIRQALALLLIDRGKKADAKPVLDAIVHDLRAQKSPRGPGGPSPDRLRAAARMYQALNESDRAGEIARWLEEAEKSGPRAAGKPAEGRVPGSRPEPDRP